MLQTVVSVVQTQEGKVLVPLMFIITLWDCASFMRQNSMRLMDRWDVLVNCALAFEQQRFIFLQCISRALAGGDWDHWSQPLRTGSRARSDCPHVCSVTGAAPAYRMLSSLSDAPMLWKPWKKTNSTSQQIKSGLVLDWVPGPSLADPYEQTIEWIHSRKGCTGGEVEITQGFTGTLCDATWTSVIDGLLFKPY